MTLEAALIDAATALGAERPWRDLSLADLAEHAGLELDTVITRFPTKASVAMALYDRLATDLVAFAPDLPKGSVAVRYKAAALKKLELIAPHRSLLCGLIAEALDPTDRLAILGPRTHHVRSRVSGVFQLVVDEATDRPTNPAIRDRLGPLLYASHLLGVLAWTQDPERVPEAIDGVCEALGLLPMLTFLPNAAGLFDRFGGLLDGPFGAVDTDPEIVEAVLQRVFSRRRLLDGVTAWPATDAALALHRPRIQAALATQSRLHLVLPAFPAKSPSPAKTLGTLPDLAEWTALRNLESLAVELEEAWPHGVHITIASDGHVFADLVGVSDAEVTAYNDAIAAWLPDNAPHLSLFGLSDVQGEQPGPAARDALVAQYARPIETLEQRAAEIPRHGRMIDGIHRFLFEDRVAMDPDTSKSQHRKATRPVAWQVVQRSEAWGALVAERFPEALRLSIHPQPDVSEKIGIHLIDTDDVWLTPWHGCARVTDAGIELVKRAHAEAAGDALVEVEGRPSHFRAAADGT